MTMRNHSVIIFLCHTFRPYPLSSSIIKLDCYARSLRRPDKLPSKISSLANANPEKYADHESLTSRGWYYPRVVAGKSPVKHGATLGWSRLVEEISEVGSDDPALPS